jgi:hypothetical protein
MSTIVFSYYGAGLSTIVFGWQLFRAWSERRWISTSYNFRGIEDPGNEVLLINHSPKPITLHNMELFWGRRYGFWVRRYRRVGEDPWGGEDSDTGTTLEPFKITTLWYSGETHFHWRHEKRPRARLYLCAQVVGRKRPVTLFVYRQDNGTPNWPQRLLIKIGVPYHPSPRYIDAPTSSGIDSLDYDPHAAR